MTNENPPSNLKKIILVPIAAVIVFLIVAQTVDYLGAKRFFTKRFETINIGDPLDQAQGLLGPPQRVVPKLDPARLKGLTEGYRIGLDENTKEYLIWARRGSVFVFGLDSEAKVTLAVIYE